MIDTGLTLENMTFTLRQEIHVQAPLETTFAALLEQLGPGNETPDGQSLSISSVKGSEPAGPSALVVTS